MRTRPLPSACGCHRRAFLERTLLGSALFWTVPGAFAQALAESSPGALPPTPPQTEGPFYPDRLPLDTDNDLIVINDSLTPAAGAITHLYGSVRTVKGEPVRNATVEIWQVDNGGRYLHSGSGGSGERDPHFQGYGRFLTSSTGEYYFRTVLPVPYGRRTPHIHAAVSVGGHRVLTTQCYIRGHEMNEGDGVLRRTPEDLRHLLMVDFEPLPDSQTGELAGRFDIVAGLTPED